MNPQKRKARSSGSDSKRQRSLPPEADGYTWVGDPLLEQNGISFYGGVELEPIEEFIDEQPNNFKLFLGDAVEIIPREDEELLQGMVNLPCGQQRVWLFKIQELIEKKGQPYCRGQWFYTLWDTIVRVQDGSGNHKLPMSETEMKAMDCQQIFLCEDNTDYAEELPLGSIKKPARVEYVIPGGKPEKNCKYWYSMLHSLENYTFRDYYEYESLAPQLIQEPKERVLQVLEVFCGCGGMSFIAGKSNGVKIKPAYAVDNDPDATATYKANHPSTTVFCCDAETFLKKCKLLGKKYEEFGVTDELCRKQPKVPIECMVIDFEIYQGEIKTFISQKKMHSCKRLSKEGVRACLALLRSTKRFPMPGDVDVIAGGPPCQDISTANLHRKQHSILESEENVNRNYQLKVFFKFIAHFRPKFTLMENVQNIFVQDDGMYIKYAIMRMLSLGYQSRAGVLSSAAYGAPQNRWRCFLWGAISGREHLPCFPAAAFRIDSLGRHARRAKKCVILPSEDRTSDMYPTTTIWDALEDLPHLSNFSLLEVMPYKSEPFRPYQFIMRRCPPEGEPSKEERLRLRESFMELTRMSTLGKLLQLSQSRGNALEQLGLHFYFSPTSYDQEVLQGYLSTLPMALRKRYEAIMAAERHAAIVRAGAEVLKALQEVQNADHSGAADLLADHRPDTVPIGKLFTIQEVPPKGGLKDLPGIVTHADGSVCSGNLHLIQASGSTECEGGGTCKVERGMNVHSYLKSRVVALEGCKAQTRIVPTGSLLAPRWAVAKEFKDKKKRDTSRVFGRYPKNTVSRTLRAHGHGICGVNVAIHPTQHRCVSVRECARIQGFPDFYVFVGTGSKAYRYKSFNKTDITSRLRQIGNSVSPLVASSLGLCLSLAASGKSDPSKSTVCVVDPAVKDAMDGRIDRCYVHEAHDFQEPIVVDESEDEFEALLNGEVETLATKQVKRPRGRPRKWPCLSDHLVDPAAEAGPSIPPDIKIEPIECDLGVSGDLNGGVKTEQGALPDLRVSIRVEGDKTIETIIVDGSVDTLDLISDEIINLMDDLGDTAASMGAMTLADKL